MIIYSPCWALGSNKDHGIQQRSWDPTKVMGSNKGHGIQQRSWDPTKVMGSNKGHGIQHRYEWIMHVRHGLYLTTRARIFVEIFESPTLAKKKLEDSTWKI